MDVWPYRENIFDAKEVNFLKYHQNIRLLQPSIITAELSLPSLPGDDPPWEEIPPYYSGTFIIPYHHPPIPAETSGP